MGSSSDSSESEYLPRLPFLASTAVVRLESSDSEEELPLFQRLAAPASRGAPVPRELLEAVRASKSAASRDQARVAQPKSGATRDPAKVPQPKSTATRDPARVPQPKSTATRDQARAPQPKKAKKCPAESLSVHIDPVLLQDGCGGQVLNALQAQEYNCVIQSQPVARSITWSRAGADGNGEAFCQEEPEMLVLVPGATFVAMVQNDKKEAYGNQSTGTLRGFVSHIKASKSRVIPSLVIMEVEKYFGDQKKGKKGLQAGGRGEGAKERKRKQKDLQELPKLSRVDVEETLMILQLQMNVHVWFLETGKEFSDFVCMFTKALAEAPTKRQRDNTSFSFCVEGDWASGVRVEKCGKGLLEVWKRQIQQFNRVSVEVASAVVAVYPSPQLLIKAYHDCQTSAERHGLLSDILVRRGEGVTSTSRRVGPELSKRIYLQLTSSQPELSLDL